MTYYTFRILFRITACQN